MAVRYLVPTGPVRGGTSPTTHRPTAHLLTEYGKPPYIVTGAAATLTCSSSKGYGQLPSILPKQPVVCACEGRSPSIAAPPVRSGSHSGGSGGRCRREHWRKRQKGALSEVELSALGALRRQSRGSAIGEHRAKRPLRPEGKRSRQDCYCSIRRAGAKAWSVLSTARKHGGCRPFVHCHRCSFT